MTYRSHCAGRWHEQKRKRARKAASALAWAERRTVELILSYAHERRRIDAITPGLEQAVAWEWFASRVSMLLDMAPYAFGPLHDQVDELRALLVPPWEGRWHGYDFGPPPRFVRSTSLTNPSACTDPADTTRQVR